VFTMILNISPATLSTETAACASATTTRANSRNVCHTATSPPASASRRARCWRLTTTIAAVAWMYQPHQHRQPNQQQQPVASYRRSFQPCLVSLPLHQHPPLNRPLSSCLPQHLHRSARKTASAIWDVMTSRTIAMPRVHARKCADVPTETSTRSTDDVRECQCQVHAQSHLLPLPNQLPLHQRCADGRISCTIQATTSVL